MAKSGDELVNPVTGLRLLTLAASSAKTHALEFTART